MQGTGVLGRYAAQTEFGKKTQTQNADRLENAAETGKSASYGKTVGNPKLSETGQKYYDELKKKFGNYDFILVSKDEKENAKANAAKYANGFKTVVLIDEEKIERMATDEKFRKQYEGILSGAAAGLEKLKAGMEQSGANVKGYGMQVNDNGTVSFFAVLKKSSEQQKARIEHKAQEKRAEKKQAAKKAEKEALAERNEKRIEKHASERKERMEALKEDTVTFTADSVEDLLKKVDEFYFEERSNQVLSESEKQVGQNIDFRG